MAIQFPACSQRRQKPADIKVDKEIEDAIGNDFRILPIFEKSLSDIKYKRYYSLENNEFLKCRWLEFKENYVDRVKVPLPLPHSSDDHFHNYRISILPMESTRNRADNRFKLSPGPGVDERGEKPIPQELLKLRTGYHKHQNRKASKV